jgi:threonine synthase
MSRIIEQNKGIWGNNFLSSLIEPEYQLSMGEGNTPFFSIQIDNQQLYLIDETQNPNQSFKDRGVAFQLSHYYTKGKRDFVISSSGNAARSVIAYANLIPDSRVDVFVSEDIPAYKLQKLGTGKGVTVHKSKRAKSDAIKFANETGAINLRASVDENAVQGFWTLGEEIIERFPQVDAIFLCCSSGTSALGIYEAMRKNSHRLPQFHIVQTSCIHPVASEFDKDFEQSDNSLGHAVADRVAHRKNSIVQILNQTNGWGWVVDDEQIREAKEIATSKGIEIEGHNAFISIAGFQKAIKSDRKFENPLCILSGI